MDEFDDYEINFSPLCQEITVDGKTVEISIYEDSSSGKWILEIEDEYDNCVLWTEQFDSDQLASNAAIASIEEEGIDRFIGKP